MDVVIIIIVSILLLPYVIFALHLIFVGICGLFVKEKQHMKESKFYRFLINSLTFMLLKFLRVKVHVNGEEKLPKNKYVVFISNHRSNFDAITGWYAFRKYHIAYISKDENFKIPFFGKVVRKCCFLSIDRKNPRKAYETICTASELIKNKQVSIGVYPEGTRSKDCVLLPFHSGVFKIAEKANTDIVVLTVRGTENIHKRTPFRKTDVYIEILDVIPPSIFKEMTAKEVSDHVREMINDNLVKQGDI